MTTRAALIILLLLSAAVAAAQVPGTGNNVTVNQGPYDYVSDRGAFRVTWPSGCGKVVRRESTDDEGAAAAADPADQFFFFNAYCDQADRPGAGCSVTSIFNAKGADGGPPGPPDVMARMEENLKSLGVVIEKQIPLRREMPDGSVIEGLEVLAREPEGPGEAWLRGLLHGRDTFLLVAWKTEGGLFNDAEYRTFFNSFEPLGH